MGDLVARLRDGAVSPYVAWMPENVLRREAAAEIKRLRDALEEISATFNKPHLMRGACMIAYAALKPQNRETYCRFFFGSGP